MLGRNPIAGMSPWTQPMEREWFLDGADRFGVPMLDLEMQASDEQLAGDWVRLVDRTKAWRARAPTVAVHYCDDVRLSMLEDRPGLILNRGDIAASVEINTSTSFDAPDAVNLYQVFRKRHLARVWQSIDVPIVVDMHVADVVIDSGFALLGVPRQWSAYAGKWVRSAGWSVLERQWSAICAHRGDTLGRFHVWGGLGQAVTDGCTERGWIHHPAETVDQMRAARA